MEAQMDKEEIIEKGMTKRDALNFLIVDETEAISGYDKVLKACDWDESDRIELERLRNAEIDHISDLSKIFNKHSTAKIVGTDSVDNSDFPTEGEQPVQDARPTEKWRMHQAPSGYYYFKAPNGETYKENGIEVRFGSKVPAGEFFVTTLFNKSLWGDEVPKVIKDAPAAGNVVKVDGGWAITSDKGWWTRYSPNGFIKFSSTPFAEKTVFTTEDEARRVAAEMLKSVYGIGDSAFSDYMAKGSFGSIGELKSHYVGASLRPRSDGMTIILKSGAELEYAYCDGGTLIFIRGRN
jgi:hypothetical protein